MKSFLFFLIFSFNLLAQDEKCLTLHITDATEFNVRMEGYQYFNNKKVNGSITYDNVDKFETILGRLKKNTQYKVCKAQNRSLFLTEDEVKANIMKGDEERFKENWETKKKEDRKIHVAFTPQFFGSESMYFSYGDQRINSQDALKCLQIGDCSSLTQANTGNNPPQKKSEEKPAEKLEEKNSEKEKVVTPEPEPVDPCDYEQMKQLVEKIQVAIAQNTHAKLALALLTLQTNFDTALEKKVSQTIKMTDAELKKENYKSLADKIVASQAKDPTPDLKALSQELRSVYNELEFVKKDPAFVFNKNNEMYLNGESLTKAFDKGNVKEVVLDEHYIQTILTTLKEKTFTEKSLPELVKRIKAENSTLETDTTTLADILNKCPKFKKADGTLFPQSCQDIGTDFYKPLFDLSEQSADITKEFFEKTHSNDLESKLKDMSITDSTSSKTKDGDPRNDKEEGDEEDLYGENNSPLNPNLNRGAGAPPTMLVPAMF